MDPLQTSIEYIKGVGPNRAALLRDELNISTFQDLLHFFPNRYIDRSTYYDIKGLPKTTSEIQIKGQITQINFIKQQRGKRMVANFEDGTGSIELVWFRGHQWIRETLKKNQPYIIFGRLNWFQGKASIAHPEMTLEADHDKDIRYALQGIYRSNEKLTNKGITQRSFQNVMKELLLSKGAHVQETLPPYLCDRLKLLPKKEALHQIHFPENQQLLSRAQLRLKFEELFYIQIQLFLKNQQRKQKIKGHVFHKVGQVFNTFFQNHLPFMLTDAQKRVTKEIRNDLGTGRQMNRLLQGDVGSGKTIVALLSMLIAIDNGFQTCLMAPTEILAQQHYKSLKELLGTALVSCEILTGSTPKKDRIVLHEQLLDGSLDILVGTHAVLEDKVAFKNLGLAIIDEQHRFGVAQRAKLWRKNDLPPHILVMTATPIPRTLAMSIYGDLDISVIDSLPPGRKLIKTVHRYDSNRLKVFGFIRDQIELGRQIYIVYPLIQESEKLDYKDLMDGYESIARSFPQPKYQISIVHGKMKSEDKAYEMERFVEGKTQIMVATTVIEVGVNVPNASVMIIESAERFGLSQLHQLRGRVGRGSDQSFCVLMSSHKLSEDAKTRLETMVRSSDGFEIAEVDLRLRGPGNLMGTQQSGVLQLKIADIIKDNDLLKAARNYAQETLKKDPLLENKENQPIKKNLAAMQFHKNIWNYIS